MTDHGDASFLSALKRLEDMAAEAQRPIPRWYRECYAESHAKGYAEYHAKGYAKGYAEGYAKGYAEGHEELLDTVRKKILQEVSSGPDPEAVGNLAERLEPIADLDLLMKISGQIRGGMSGPELLAWMDAQA